VYKPTAPARVTPTLVKQYSYCPLIPWIQAWFCAYEPTTDSMALGKESTKPPEGRGQVYVSTVRGAAVIDELVEEGGCRVIVERKAYRSHNYSRYVEQAVASYLVAREKIPGIRRVRLEVQGRQSTIELSGDLVEDVESLVKVLEKALKSEKPPPAKPDPKKCTSCWYKRYCPHN